MNPPHTHALYGTPPRELATAHPDSVQYSPLIPGSSSLELCMPGSVSGATIHAPAGTLERRYVLALTLRALAAGAPLTVLAPNDKGGNRLAAELKNFGCDIVENSRSHYRICTSTRPAHLAPIEDAMLAGGPHVHPTLGLWTQPGIFSWDRLDVGTALLLKHLPALSGHGADFGCGLGIISRAVFSSASVTALTLIDIDRRAVDAARRNVADARASFEWADIRQLTFVQSPFDFVVMNPPFHDSGIEDKHLGQLFIERATGALKHGGSCWLTANRHLPYEALLASRFSRVDLVDEADGFKIYAAVK